MNELEKIQPILAKLVDGNDLTAKEAEELVYTIFVHDDYGMHFATWVGAIHAKGETADELVGFLNATKRLAVKFDLDLDIDKTTDLSGTGGGGFKTINVSTAASFVVAAAGFTVAKEAYYAATSPTGSADMFTAFGVDFLKVTKEQVEETLKEVGICPIIAPFISPKMENRSQLSRKFFVERKVGVRSPFHLASNVYSPVPMNHRIYGSYSEKYLEILANLFVELGFKRTLTFYGKPGIPELSNTGETIVVEQNDSEIKRYTVNPEGLGVKQVGDKDIATGGKEQNIKDFVDILKGDGEAAKRDLVAVNAGASFYSLEDVNSLKEGTEKALDILSSNKPFEKFEKVITKIGNPSLLNKF